MHSTLKINSPHTQKKHVFWGAEGFLEKSLLPRSAGVVESDLLLLMIPINLIN